MIFLPLAGFLILFRLNWSQGVGPRVAFLRASILWALLASGLTEVLSAFGALHEVGLGWAWVAVDVVALSWLLRLRTRIVLPSAREWLGVVLGKLDGACAVLIAGGLVIVAVIGLIAIAAPPNTVDAMEYHMPRIVQWLHHRSTEFYATHDLRQLKMPPWTECAMLQFHGLSRGDRFDNLVQWFSFGGTAIAVSLIAQLLGGGMRSQILAAVLSLTIPQGVLEASGAKNDYVVAYWLAAVIYFSLSLGRKVAWGETVWLGCAFGLACYTKATAFVIGPPLIAAVLLSRPSTNRLRLGRTIAAVALIALAINGLHFWRNWELFHSILGPAAQVPPNGFKVTNDKFGLSVTASNVLRNIALHVSTPVDSWNAQLESSIGVAIRFIGEDPNDPRSTWDETQFHIPPMTLHESTAGNLLHAGLVLLVLGFLLHYPIREEDRPAVSLIIGLAAAFCLFCALFKWQPWNTRLHLPLFVVFAGIAGVVLTKRLPKVLSCTVGIAALLAAAPYVLANEIRSLVASGGSAVFSVPRTEQYFSDRRQLLEPYREAVRFADAQGCRAIGLDLSASSYEYPLYVLLNDLDGSRRVSAVNVRNESSRFASPSDNAVPCVICPECGMLTTAWARLYGRFKTARLFDHVAVFSDNGTNGSDGCVTEFAGWYGTERDSGGWWRWSSGKGSIRIAASGELQISLTGGITTVPDPNTARVVLNGQEVARLELGGQKTTLLAPITLNLHHGINDLQFLSEQPPVTVPNDSRPLAIAVRNLALRSKDGHTCELNP